MNKSTFRKIAANLPVRFKGFEDYSSCCSDEEEIKYYKSFEGFVGVTTAVALDDFDDSLTFQDNFDSAYFDCKFVKGDEVCELYAISGSALDVLANFQSSSTDISEELGILGR